MLISDQLYCANSHIVHSGAVLFCICGYYFLAVGE